MNWRTAVVVARMPGPIRGREDDMIGVGYYHLGVGNVPLLTLTDSAAEDDVEISLRRRHHPVVPYHAQRSGCRSRSEPHADSPPWSATGPGCRSEHSWIIQTSARSTPS
jgi:hypothetical protein